MREGLNHYVILGLSETGRDPNRLPYSEEAIKSAYRAKALETHPDKNQDNPNAENLFKSIKDSYDVLSDSEKRAFFDKELEENPEIFAEREHIFAETDGHDPVNENVKKDENPLALDLIKPKGIDLTQLMQHADSSPETIIAYARKNMALAQALFSNPKTLSLLPFNSQAVLILLICEHIHNQYSPEEAEQKISVFFSTPQSSFFLKKIASNNQAYDLAFLDACLQEAEKVRKIFKYIQVFWQSLSYSSLRTLSNTFYEALPVFLKKYFNRLRLEELIYFIEKYPNYENEIANCLSEKEKGKIKNFQELSKIDWPSLLKSEKSQMLKEKISMLGISAFSLIDRIHIEDGLTCKIVKACVQLRISVILSEPISQHWSSMEEQEKKFLANIAISNLTNKVLLQESLNIKGFLSDDVFGFNFSASGLILREINEDLFLQLIKMIKLDFFSQNVAQHWLRFVLSKTFDDASEENPQSEFLRLLKSNYPEIWIFLANNLSHISTFLYAFDMVSLAFPIQRDLGRFFASKKMRLDPDKTFPEDFMNAYSAASIFYEYLREKQEKEKELGEILKTDNKKWHATLLLSNKFIYLSRPRFFEIFEKTGFFTDLFKLKTEDNVIKCVLVQEASALIKENKFPSDLLFEFRGFLGDVLKDARDDEIRSLLPYFSEKTNEQLVTLLERSEYFSAYRWQIMHRLASIDLGWLNQRITGALLENFVEKFPRTRDGFSALLNLAAEGIEWDDYFHYLLPIKNQHNALPETAGWNDNIFNLLKKTLENHLRKKYPSCFFSSYFSLVNAPWFIDKVSAFQELKDTLNLWKQHPYDNEEIALTKLMGLLKRTAVDLMTFRLLKKALRGSQLWEALLFFMRETGDFIILESASKAIVEQEYSIQNHDYHLECRFYCIAKHRIAALRERTPSDALLKMVKAHGEKIIGDLVTYNLTGKYALNRRLDESFNKARKFVTEAPDPEQIVRDLYVRFQNLVNTCIAENLFACEHNSVFFYELNAIIKKYPNKGLASLLDTYPLDDPKNLLLWLFNLALKEDEFAKNKINIYLDNPNIFKSFMEKFIAKIPDISVLASLLSPRNFYRIISWLLVQENTISHPLRTLLYSSELEGPANNVYEKMREAFLKIDQAGKQNAHEEYQLKIEYFLEVIRTNKLEGLLEKIAEEDGRVLNFENSKITNLEELIDRFCGLASQYAINISEAKTIQRNLEERKESIGIQAKKKIKEWDQFKQQHIINRFDLLSTKERKKGIHAHFNVDYLSKKPSTDFHGQKFEACRFATISDAEDLSGTYFSKSCNLNFANQSSFKDVLFDEFTRLNFTQYGQKILLNNVHELTDGESFEILFTLISRDDLGDQRYIPKTSDVLALLKAIPNVVPDDLAKQKEYARKVVDLMIPRIESLSELIKFTELVDTKHQAEKNPYAYICEERDHFRAKYGNTRTWGHIIGKVREQCEKHQHELISAAEYSKFYSLQKTHQTHTYGFGRFFHRFMGKDYSAHWKKPVNLGDEAVVLNTRKN